MQLQAWVAHHKVLWKLHEPPKFSSEISNKEKQRGRELENQKFVS
jgi:hypothetical protein